MFGVIMNGQGQWHKQRQKGGQRQLILNFTRRTQLQLRQVAVNLKFHMFWLFIEIQMKSFAIAKIEIFLFALDDWLSILSIFLKSMILAQTFTFMTCASLIERRGNFDIIIVTMLSFRKVILVIISMRCPSQLHLFFEVFYADFGQAEYLLHQGVLEEFTLSLIRILFDYKIIIIRAMKQRKRSGIEEYEDLLVELKQYGPYQIRLIAIMMLYWFLSGINQGIFYISLAWQDTQFEFYIEESLQFVNILAFTYLSLYISRYYVNLIVIAIVAVGCIFAIAGVFSGVVGLKDAGVFIIVTFHYSLAYNLFMINLEFHRIKQYSKLWMLALLALLLGKLTSVSIASNMENEAETAYKVILPGCILYVLTSFLYFESPRFLIDQDFEKGELLLKKVSEINNVRHQQINMILQRQYFWNKVNLQKYSILTLFQYGSVSYNTYLLVISSLLLGLIERCPDFIQHLQSKTNFKVEDSVEIAWVSFFQICALFFSYFASYFLKRKGVVIFLSIILLLISCFLVLLDQSNLSVGDAVLYSMAIFGLNSFFAIALFFFLILSSIQFYPHTIRTLSCGLIMASQKLGKMVFSLHNELIARNQIMLELVVCCSILLVFHLSLVKETLGESGSYQIEEIEEKENEDY